MPAAAAYSPAGQEEHEVEPAALYLPTAQDLQLGSARTARMAWLQ